MAPLSRIQATAAEVSRPPEKAMPTRSPTGSDVKTLLTGGEATDLRGGGLRFRPDDRPGRRIRGRIDGRRDLVGDRGDGPVQTAEAGHGDQRRGAGDGQLDVRETPHVVEVG